MAARLWSCLLWRYGHPWRWPASPSCARPRHRRWRVAGARQQQHEGEARAAVVWRCALGQLMTCARAADHALQVTDQEAAAVAQQPHQLRHAAGAAAEEPERVQADRHLHQHALRRAAWADLAGGPEGGVHQLGRRVDREDGAKERLQRQQPRADVRRVVAERLEDAPPAVPGTLVGRGAVRRRAFGRVRLCGAAERTSRASA